MKVAFIGLGVMGYPMAGHLKNVGMDVCVYNRSGEKASKWCQQYGGEMAASPAAAAQQCEVVLICVGNDDDVRQVVLGSSGALAGMDAGATLVDHTTASASLARELADIAMEQQKNFLDAPVSGGQAGAENGALTVMAGGEPVVYAAVKPVLDSYSKFHQLLGPSGSGQLAKMVNQICCSCSIQALAEGMNFALKAGLDAHQVVDVISKGAAQSWQMENRGKTMVDGKFDFGFAVDWMRKDLDICLDEARANGAQLPLTALVETFYARVQARGDGRMDNTSLFKLLSEA